MTKISGRNGKMTQFGTWLSGERARISANDVDLRELVSDAPRLTRYVRSYLALARVALDDALICVPPMDADDPVGRQVWEENRSAFVDHLTEGALRLAHLLVAVGCSDKELASRYEKLLAPVMAVEAPDATEESSVPEEECPHGDEVGTLCTDVPELADVAEK